MAARDKRATLRTGSLAHCTKDQLYQVRHGYIFASSRVQIESRRFSASILLTLNSARFKLSAGGKTGHHEAAALRPMIKQRVDAKNVGLICIGINPDHPLYRRFRAIQTGGSLRLPRDAFATLDDDLQAIHAGTLAAARAQELFYEVTSATAHYLPRVQRADPRVERAIEMLRANPNYPLGALAAALGLSYDRMSHLFADGVGLPLRSYLLWQKLQVVTRLIGTGKSLADISIAAGFSDGSHLSNSWQKAYGISPSYLFRSDDLETHAVARTQTSLASAPAHQSAASKSAVADMAALPDGPTCQHCGSPRSAKITPDAPAYADSPAQPQAPESTVASGLQ